MHIFVSKTTSLTDCHTEKHAHLCVQDYRSYILIYRETCTSLCLRLQVLQSVTLRNMHISVSKATSLTGCHTEKHAHHCVQDYKPYILLHRETCTSLCPRLQVLQAVTQRNMYTSVSSNYKSYRLSHRQTCTRMHRFPLF